MPRRVGAYAKLLSNYASDDAIIAAGEKAELLFVRGLAFCSTSDSDGYITDGQLVRIVGAGMRDVAARAKALVSEGLWTSAEGGYQVRSWTKVHETAEEKGRQRRTDRERKRRDKDLTDDRIPPGTPPELDPDSDPDSEGNGDRNPPDSLDCSYVSTPTGQSNPRQSRAGTSLALLAPTDSAQTIVAEWIDRCQKRPPERVIGQISKSTREMLAEGIDPDDIRRGLSTWMTKPVAPSLLPAIVNEVMNAHPANGRSRQQAETDAIFERAAQRLGATP